MAVQDRLLGLSGGVALKAPVVVASTGNLTLSSSQTIDGIVVGTSDDEGTRILVKDQTDAKENGVYVSSATWVRAKDFDGKRDALPGSLIYVDRGTVNGKTFWAFNSSSTASSITVGSTGDNITVSQVTQALGVIPLTTEGDLLVYTSGAATRLAVGATNTVLVSTGTVPSWSLISSGNISTGGIIAENLGSSAVTTAKIANSAVTGPKIQMTSTADATGDILIRGSTAYERLAKGSSDLFLRAGATKPEWATPSAVSIETFSSSDTWTKPTGAAVVRVQAWGGGASGGTGRTNAGMGGGGGGGAYVDAWLAATDLGATETVTIGAGGAAVTATETGGNAGGNTTFGSAVTAYGGGAGSSGTITTDTGSGGGGGGALSAGSIGVSGGPGTGGAGGNPPGGDGYGGASGGAGKDSGDGTGGTSSGKGGAGGGGGSFNGNGGAGGASVWGGGGGGGGSNVGTPGAGGASIYGGNGGAGATGANNATAGAQPGGGGGGAETGNSGAGGAGKIIVTVWS